MWFVFAGARDPPQCKMLNGLCFCSMQDPGRVAEGEGGSSTLSGWLVTPCNDTKFLHPLDWWVTLFVRLSRCWGLFLVFFVFVQARLRSSCCHHHLFFSSKKGTTFRDRGMLVSWLWQANGWFSKTMLAMRNFWQREQQLGAEPLCDHGLIFFAAKALTTDFRIFRPIYCQEQLAGMFWTFIGAAQYILQTTNNKTGKNAGLCMHCTKTYSGHKWKIATLKPHFGWQALLLISFGMGKK